VKNLLTLFQSHKSTSKVYYISLVNKTTIRKTFLERRKNLSRSQYWTLNEKVVEQVAHINWAQFKTAHLFMPITDNKEVDTFSILEHFKEHEPNLRVVIPRTNFEKIEMENILFDPIYTILGRNKYGIPEPIHGRVIHPHDIDVVIMPLLAFDQEGNRVGYGKGFYDRFLDECRPDVKRIGLSFFAPVEKVDDVNEFDKRLDACITPDRIWEFEKL
jgi:5-formyltetrahydrofolate cyclo-ligase